MKQEIIRFDHWGQKVYSCLKLLHAYERICIELDRCNTVDSVVRHNMIIYENYGPNVQECVEKDYELKGMDF